MVRSNNYFSSYRVNKNFFKSLTLTFDLGQKKCGEGLNVCKNYAFTLLHHVGVVAKRVCAAAAAGRWRTKGTTIPLRRGRGKNDYSRTQQFKGYDNAISIMKGIISNTLQRSYKSPSIYEKNVSYFIIVYKATAIPTSVSLSNI